MSQEVREREYYFFFWERDNFIQYIVYFNNRDRAREITFLFVLFRPWWKNILQNHLNALSARYY